MASGVSICAIERLLNTDRPMRQSSLDRVEREIQAGAGSLPWAEPTDADFNEKALEAPKEGFSKSWLAKSFACEAASAAKSRSVDGFLERAGSAGFLVRSSKNGKWKVADPAGCKRAAAR